MNVFMERFIKRLTKGLLVGAAFVLLVLISPLIMSENPLSAFPWYLVPVVLIVTVLYGTGWYFGFALIKRFFRKFLRINRDASIMQALLGRGLIMGFAMGLLCLTIGCFITFFVGNIFMVMDFIKAKQGHPAVSEKFKFDSDLEYDSWAEEIATVRNVVKYNEAVYGADESVQMENKKNLEEIEKGNFGTVTTVVNENGNKKVNKTDIY